MKKVLFLLFVAGGMALGAGAANAHMDNCGPIDAVRSQVNEHHDEVPVFSGREDSQPEYTGRLWVDLNDGSWTMTVENEERGLMCLIASGDSFNFDRVGTSEAKPEGDAL